MYFIFFLVLFVMFLKAFHLLSFFISLEMVGLLVLLFMILLFTTQAVDQSLLVYFICLLGCESALGLVLFVLFTRSFSKDYFYSLGLTSF